MRPLLLLIQILLSNPVAVFTHRQIIRQFRDELQRVGSFRRHPADSQTAQRMFPPRLDSMINIRHQPRGVVAINLSRRTP